VPHMRAFDSLGQRQRDAAELIGGHDAAFLILQKLLHRFRDREK
jgi:hypothetical protein